MHKESVLTVLIASVPAILQADTVYKWVDERGQVHYAEQPPAHAKTQTLDIETAATPPQARPPLKFTYTTPKSSKKKKIKRSKQRRRAAQLAQRCEKYRDKHRYYTSKMRLGYKAKQYNTLEDKRRYYRDQVARYCR